MARLYRWRGFLILMNLLPTLTLADPYAPPRLWQDAVAISANNYPFSWRELNNYLSNVSQGELEVFGKWKPGRFDNNPNFEDLYLFIWTRTLECKRIEWGMLSDSMKWTNSARPLIKLHHDQSIASFSGMVLEIETGVENDPYDFGFIRALGLVPIDYAERAIAVLKKYIDPATNNYKATGIYGEEMLEIQDLLMFRLSQRSC
jgi:hypothetical protein